MATFTYTPSFEATEISKPRVVTFQAGDGYQQRVGFGLHRDGKEWQLHSEPGRHRA
jgi:phage-related protein